MLIKPYYEDDSVTLYCGAMEKVLPEIDLSAVDTVITDPPYGMRLDTNFANRKLSEKAYRKHNKQRNYDAVIGDEKDFEFQASFILLETVKEQLWWGADYYRSELPAGGSWNVWDKREGLEDVKYTTSEFELCWSRIKHQRKIYRVRWFGLCGMETQDTKKRLHPTQKPIELLKQQILDTKAQMVIDPFVGSGTTLIAAKLLKRRAIGIEISEEYCKLIVNRLNKPMPLFEQQKDEDLFAVHAS